MNISVNIWSDGSSEDKIWDNVDSVEFCCSDKCRIFVLDKKGRILWIYCVRHLSGTLDAWYDCPECSDENYSKP